MGEHPDGLQDLVTRAAIARRLHLSPGRLEAALRAHGFPAPLGRLGAQIVWRWADVRAWAERAQVWTGAGRGPDGLVQAPRPEYVLTAVP